MLGVAEDTPDAGDRPCAECPFGVGRFRRGEQVGVGVEPVADPLKSQPAVEVKVVDVADHGAADVVRDQAGLGLALLSEGGDRVRDLLGLVAVRRSADIEALFGVFFEAVPGLFHRFQGVPLGDALLDAARQDRGGSLASGVHGLVGSGEQYADLFELVFDLGAVVGASCYSVDGFADDAVESAVGPARFREQILDAAIARDRDVELLASVAEPTATDRTRHRRSRRRSSRPAEERRWSCPTAEAGKAWGLGDRLWRCGPAMPIE